MVQRSKSHVWVGLAFVLAAVAIAGAGYAGMKSLSDQPAAANAAQVSSAATGPDAKLQAATSPQIERPAPSSSQKPSDADIRALLAPGVSLSASASSGPGYCNGPVTYVFYRSGMDGMDMVRKRYDGEATTYFGEYSVHQGAIHVRNVMKEPADPSKESTPADDWTLVVTAVDPNGSEGGDLIVRGDGRLIGCNAGDLD